MSKYEYDFHVSAPPVGKPRKHPDLKDRIASMPEGASFFVAAAHKNNTVASTVSQMRKESDFVLVCRREERDGIEGFRIWRLKDKEK